MNESPGIPLPASLDLVRGIISLTRFTGSDRLGRE